MTEKKSEKKIYTEEQCMRLLKQLFGLEAKIEDLRVIQDIDVLREATSDEHGDLTKATDLTMDQVAEIVSQRLSDRDKLVSQLRAEVLESALDELQEIFTRHLRVEKILEKLLSPLMDEDDEEDTNDQDTQESRTPVSKAVEEDVRIVRAFNHLWDHVRVVLRNGSTENDLAIIHSLVVDNPDKSLIADFITMLRSTDWGKVSAPDNKAIRDSLGIYLRKAGATLAAASREYEDFRKRLKKGLNKPTLLNQVAEAIGNYQEIVQSSLCYRRAVHRGSHADSS